MNSLTNAPVKSRQLAINRSRQPQARSVDHLPNIAQQYRRTGRQYLGFFTVAHHMTILLAPTKWLQLSPEHPIPVLGVASGRRLRVHMVSGTDCTASLRAFHLSGPPPAKSPC